MHHFFIDKIPLDELKVGQFVFSKERGAMLSGNIPTKVTVYNKEKPYLLSNAYPAVSENDLDETVKDKWRTFYKLMVDKDAAGEIIWQRGGESYLRKIVDYLKSGHEVIFDGQLQKLEWYKWLEDEPPVSKKKGKSAPPALQPFDPMRGRLIEDGAIAEMGMPDMPDDMDMPMPGGNVDQDEEMPQARFGIEAARQPPAYGYARPARVRQREN